MDIYIYISMREIFFRANLDAFNQDHMRDMSTCVVINIFPGNEGLFGVMRQRRLDTEQSTFARKIEENNHRSNEHMACRRSVGGNETHVRRVSE